MLNALFPENLHAIDRLLRLALGSALLMLVLVGPKTPWGLIGLVFVATGLLGSCPIYRVLGISTCGRAGGSVHP